MKKALLILLGSFIAASCAAAADGPLTEDEVRDLILAAPSEADRPDEDALVLFEGHFYKHDGGKTEVRRQRLIKIYSEWAIEHLGDPQPLFGQPRLVAKKPLDVLDEATVAELDVNRGAQAGEKPLALLEVVLALVDRQTAESSVYLFPIHRLLLEPDHSLAIRSTDASHRPCVWRFSASNKRTIHPSLTNPLRAAPSGDPWLNRS